MTRRILTARRNTKDDNIDKDYYDSSIRTNHQHHHHQRSPSWQKEQQQHQCQPFDFASQNNRECVSPPPPPLPEKKTINNNNSTTSKAAPFDGDTNVASLIYPSPAIMIRGGNARDVPTPRKLQYDNYNNNNNNMNKKSSSSSSLHKKLSPTSPVRFTPDTSIESQHELNPEEDGAVQFVPALEEAAAGGGGDYNKNKSSSRMVRRQAAAAEAASWDALILDEEKKEPESPTSMQYTNHHHHHPLFDNINHNKDGATQSSVSGHRGGRVPAVGGRIARLASLFTSSRAETNNINGHGNNPVSLASLPKYNIQPHGQRSVPPPPPPPPPISPAQSSGSSAYIGWPGTQDRRGHTVSQPSSYDDSSVSAGGAYPLQRSHATTSNATPRKHHHNNNNNAVKTMSNASDKEIQEAAFREMDRGLTTGRRDTNNAPFENDAFFPSADNSATPLSRPRRRIDVPANRQSSPVSSSSSPGEEEEDRILHKDSSDNANDADDSSAGRRRSDDEEEEELNAADYHLAAAVANAKRSVQQENNTTNRTSMSALQYAKSDIGVQAQKQLASSPWHNRQASLGDGDNSSHSVRFQDVFPPDRSDPTCRDQWGESESSSVPTTSSPEGSTVSKTSSAYFSAKLMKTPSYTASNGVSQRESVNGLGTCTSKFGRYGDIRSAADAAASQLLWNGIRVAVVPPTQDSLAAKDRMMAPPNRAFNNAEGFRALLDKTKDVPSLLDNNDSDSMSSSKATSVFSGTGSQHQIRFQQDSMLNHNYHHPISANRASPRSILKKKLVDLDAESDVFDDVSTSKESDVFDNISGASPRKSSFRMNRANNYPARIAEDDSEGSRNSGDHNNDDVDVANNSGEFKLVVLAGGLATIQTSEFDYFQRQTASDYDDQLTTSEVSSNGYAKIPGFHEMITAGTDKDSSLHGINGNLGASRRTRKTQTSDRSLVLDDVTNNSGTEGTESEEEEDSDDSSSSDYDVDGYLAQYYVKPAHMKRVLRRYRELSESTNFEMSLEEREREADEHKAFALFEMRSRIMEKDIERGLERRGGSTVVDDIVTTPYYRAAHRIRDAVIVCKAWRDGASVSDVVKASLLGRRSERTLFIGRRNGSNEDVNDSASSVIGCSSTSPPGGLYWEPVKWLDDTDFMQYRCPSLGARCMRGTEMFTIGDCQSMLLKLTNERCMELRWALNDATSRQIEAEDMLKDEGEYFDGEMTEAEVLYLASMEEVKMISKKLVQAEQAFSLVRDRIKKLIAKYESILMKLETNSSTVTYESSFYSDHDSLYWDEIERREAEMWARRARRAEIRAEIAAREAFLAKQETRLVQEEKQRELDLLKQKLLEVQSEASTTTFENTALLARSFVLRRNGSAGRDTAKAVKESNSRINNEKIQDVKQRFRERVAAKKQVLGAQPASSLMYKAPYNNRSSPRVVASRGRPHNSNSKDLFRSAEEEMFQQMDFYERSLNAVDRTRA